MTDSMTDEEIRENLLKRGVNIGPVVDSTRSFYRKKLARLLGEIKDEPAPQSSGGEGTASESEEVEEKRETTKAKSKSPVQSKEQKAKDDPFPERYSPPGEIRARRSIHSYNSSTKSSYDGASSLSNPAQKNSGTGNAVMLLCFVLGIIVILYVTLFASSSETAVETK